MAEETALNLPSPNPAVAFRIGELLVEAGLLTREQAGDVAKFSFENNLGFGEAAVAMALVSQEDLDGVLSAGLEGRTISEQTKVSKEVICYHEPDSLAAENVRSLRNALSLRWFHHPQGGRALAIVSPGRGEGRSLTAANLAVAFAQVDVRTLLIDADLRQPKQHELFGLANASGLSGYLYGRTDEAAHYEIPYLESLTVIPVGPLPPNPQELLLRPTLQALLESASQQFEVILIDTPAAVSGADFNILARVARGALLLAQERSSKMREAAKMVAGLRDLGVQVVGGSLLESRKR